MKKSVLMAFLMIAVASGGVTPGLSLAQRIDPDTDIPQLSESRQKYASLIRGDYKGGQETLNTTSTENMSFSFEPSDIALFQGSKYSTWKNRIQTAYDDMKTLTGLAPYHPDKTEIKSTRTLNSGAWGQAGNPILINRQYVPDIINRINAMDDWVFGVLHELGHNFTSYRWNFDTEFWANIGIYYVVDTNNATVYAGYTDYYTGGQQLKRFYKSESYADSPGHPNQAYDYTVAQGIYGHKGLVYNFIVIEEQIGWQPFIQTFQYFCGLPFEYIPVSNIGKFNLFVTKLKDFSNVDVLALISTEDKNVYEQKFGGEIKYIEMLSDQEIYGLADHFLQNYGNSAYTALNEHVPLFDDSHALFAYAVPFVNDANQKAGHINIGARLDGSLFYLIDPFTSNYSNIERYSLVGWAVKYAPPFTYYYGTSLTHTAPPGAFGRGNLFCSPNPQEPAITERRSLFNEENAVCNRALLDSIKDSATVPNIPAASTSVAGHSRDLSNTEYVCIMDAFEQPVRFADYTCVLHTPSSYVGINDVEQFIVEQLNSDIPVFMHTLLNIGIDNQYILNTPAQNFTDHCMTITKFYKNVNSAGNDCIAFSSWSQRFFINADLLKIKADELFCFEDYYYPDFYAYEEIPRTGQ